MSTKTIPSENQQTTPKMNVSQGTLDLLQQGYDRLTERREQLAQQLSELDVAIQRQTGGITLMQNLLANAVAEADPSTSEDGNADGDPPAATTGEAPTPQE